MSTPAANLSGWILTGQCFSARSVSPPAPQPREDPARPSRPELQQRAATLRRGPRSRRGALEQGRRVATQRRWDQAPVAGGRAVRSGPSAIPRGVSILRAGFGKGARCPQLLPNTEKRNLDLKFEMFLLLSESSPPPNWCFQLSSSQESARRPPRSVPSFPASPGILRTPGPGPASRPGRLLAVRPRGLGAAYPALRDLGSRRARPRPRPARDREARPAWGEAGAAESPPALAARRAFLGRHLCAARSLRAGPERVNFLLPPRQPAPPRAPPPGRPPARALRHRPAPPGPAGRRHARPEPVPGACGVSFPEAASPPEEVDAAMHIYVGLATSGCGRGGPGSPRSGPRGGLA